MIFRRFLAEPHLLDLDEVEQVAVEGGIVGSCDCGGYLAVDGVPAPSWRSGPVWVLMLCRTCGRDYAAPDGRLVRSRKRHGDLGVRSA